MMPVAHICSINSVTFPVSTGGEGAGAEHQTGNCQLNMVQAKSYEKEITRDVLKLKKYI